MRTIIFDLDGTLADTSGDLIAAANATLDEHGLALDPSRDQATALKGGRAMLRLAFKRAGPVDETEITRLYPRLLQNYGAALDIHTQLYPGAMEAVEQLKARGHPVGICTNKPEGLAEQLLQSLGVRSAFGSLIGADTLPVRKPDPEALYEAVRRAGGDPAHACLVGDTLTDHSTARAAGAASVLVTFAPGGSDMAAMEPDALLDHFCDLPEVIDRLAP